MSLRNLARLTLVSTLAVGTFIAGVPAEVAAGEATITLATPELAPYSGDPDGDGEEETDGDHRADDLIIGFTESGTGNPKGTIVELSVTRTVTVTCVSKLSQFTDTESETFTWFDGDDPSDPTAFNQTSDQKAGKWVLQGSFIVRTRFEEVCGRSEPGDTGEVYFVKDYSVTYTDVTVKDAKNGVEASDPGPYSFQDTLEGGFTTPDAELAGFRCTVESLESGHCESN